MNDQIKTLALIINVQNYKETDKVASAFSLDLGKIFMTFKGVTSPKAKLKITAQPFCFGEYMLTKSGAGYIVTGGVLTESFYDLSQNIDKYFLGCVILELLDKTVQQDEPNPALFLETLKALKELSFGNADGNLIVAKFFINALDLLGYSLNFSKCVHCKAAVNKPYFSALRGGLLCPLCADNFSKQVNVRLMNNLRFVNNTPYETLNTVKTDGQAAKNLLKFMSDTASELLEVKLVCIDNIIKV